jgi:hypothetical protein
MFYWILTTHIISLLPLLMLAHSFNQYRQYESLYTLLNIFFTVYSSIWYHTYNYDNVIDLHNQTQITWRLMDHWLSSSSIVATNMYCFKVRAPVFYIVANTSSVIILYFKLTNVLAYNLFIFIVIITTILIKFRIVIGYIKNYYFRSFLVMCTAGTSIYAIYIPPTSVYYLWHPIWHICIFTTAFIGCSMRHSLDTKLLEDMPESSEYARAAADSL